MITFTPAAAEKVRAILEEDGTPGRHLRVFVEGGGCSGFQYGFTLEDAPEEDDLELETNGIKVLVDPMSLQYLQGATVDYVEELSGCRFEIKNPNASGSCGCGSSFSV